MSRRAYIYQAALWCGDCIRDVAPGGFDPERLGTEDSDDYPAGPYPDGGGESDSPAHCDGCNMFLKNPLTGHGEAYVQGAVLEGLVDRDPSESVAVQTWAPHYDWVDLPPVWVADDPDTLAAFREGYRAGERVGKTGQADFDADEAAERLEGSPALEAFGAGLRWGHRAATEGVGA